MAKLSFDESTLFIIRSYYDGEDNVKYYYQTPDEWTFQPSMATIFRDYDIAESHKSVAYVTDPQGLVYEVVSLKHEMIEINRKQKTPK